MKKALFVLIVMFFMTGCLPRLGSTGEIRDDGTKVVADWNVPSQVKPVACLLNEGDQVTILEYSNLFLGSSESEKIVLIEHDDCKGWIFVHNLK